MQLIIDKVKTRAVDVLKVKLTMLPVLAVPLSNGQYTIDSDACTARVVCVLLQELEDEVLKPIGYWSRSLCYAERRTDTTHEEYFSSNMGGPHVEAFPKVFKFLHTN